MATDYGKFKASCWAVVGQEETVLDVVQVSAEYPLNGIPSATVTLALGNNVATGEESEANSRFEANLFQFREKIFIYASMELESYSASNEAATATNDIVRGFKPTVIFEGYITGFGYQRSGAASVLSVSIEHWLSDLTASTMISASTHATTPTDLQASVLNRSFVPGSANAAGLMSSSWIEKLPLSTDNLWEQGIKVIAKAGASSNALVNYDNSFNISCYDGGSPQNKAALDALERMEGVLELKTTSGSNVISAINEDLAFLFLDNLVGQTIWDCIISSSANYMFAVAPQIGKTIVMPFMPAISGTPFKSIGADQLYSASISGSMPRTIRAVGILFLEKGILNSPNDTKVNTSIGRYVSNNDCKGTVLFKQAPAWLNTSTTIGYSSGEDKVQASTKGVSSGSNPDGGVKSTKPSVSQNIEESQSIRDDYAKSVYGYEILKGRQGTITGPFRLDIGVGSYIEFEIPGNLHQDASNPKYFRGIVVKVELSLDAQSANAGTTYTVAYVRRKDEDDEKVITMGTHPIYNSMYPIELGTAMDI